MSNNFTPEICGQDGVYAPALEPCDECDRLAAEFSQALEDSQAAAADAKSYAESAEDSASDASNSAGEASDSADAAEGYANDAANALAQINSYAIERFSEVFNITSSTDTITFSPPGYIYSEGDEFSVYVNGLKLNESEYTLDGNVITLNTPLSSGTVEVIVDRTLTVNRDERIYGARWDRTTNLLTRIKDAENITTDTTNFKHSGTFNPNINNPFDSLYPWSEIKTVNVDLTAYAALPSGRSIRDCITAVYGDPDFTYFGTDALFVGVYIPEFWYWSEEDSSGRVSFYISTNSRLGFKHHEEEVRAISFAVDVGNSKVSSGVGVPLTNVAVSTIHSRAHNQGFTITDIFSDDAVIMLYLVEYANMNAQAALGDGCSNCYRENAADVIANLDNSGTETVFEVTDSALSSVIFKGSQVDFGTSVGATTYKAVVADFTVNGSTYTITLDRKLSDLTNGMYMSVHGFATCEFPYIGQSVGNGSGYIGTNGKANAYYRGMVLWGSAASPLLKNPQ